MESQPQNPEFRINPENFHPCLCKYTLVIPSSYAGGDFVCLGTLREGSLVEDWRVENALAKTTLFSCFLSAILLTFLSFSLFVTQQFPRYSNQVQRHCEWCRCIWMWIPNLVYGCILGWQCCVPFLCHCDLDLIFRIIMFRAYLLNYLG